MEILPSVELLKCKRSRMDLHVLRLFGVVPVLGVGYPGLTSFKNLVTLRELNPGHRFAKAHFVLFDEPLQPGPHLGGCQNYGPFLGTLNIRCCIRIGVQTGTLILTTNHLQLVGDFEVWEPISECQITWCCPILSTTKGQRLTERSKCVTCKPLEVI